MKHLLPCFLGLFLSACTLVGQGEGDVESQMLHVKDCWQGPFDLRPDFFAAVPYRDTMQLRIQHGSDLHEVSDGVAILLNGVEDMRKPENIGKPLQVGLSPQLLNEIAPGVPVGEAPPVQLSLYLQFSCHNQNSVLYAVDGTITFEALFNGDPNESDGNKKLTVAKFDVLIADPRDADPGTLNIPDDKTSRLEGEFRFHFQRGQPGQPFP